MEVTLPVVPSVISFYELITACLRDINTKILLVLMRSLHPVVV